MLNKRTRKLLQQIRRFGVLGVGLSRDFEAFRWTALKTLYTHQSCDLVASVELALRLEFGTNLDGPIDAFAVPMNSAYRIGQ